MTAANAEETDQGGIPMKITTFDPMILSADAENITKLFEELGFEKTHSPVTDTQQGEITTVRMKYEKGFHVDIANVPVAQDNTLIRMNVDDFDEAYKILTANGFKNTRGDDTVNTKTSQAATMVSPCGLTIVLVKHIKK